jgi:hypothetical protein
MVPLSGPAPCRRVLPGGGGPPARPDGEARPTQRGSPSWSPATTTKKVNGHRRKVRKCTGRLVSGTIKFTTSRAHVTVSRGRRVYATGLSLQLGRGVTQLLLSDLGRFATDATR